MSLIGGYFCPTGKLEDSAVEEKVRSFSIIPNDSSESYETIVRQSRFGHFVAKYKSSAPPQIKYKSGINHTVVTLGFHDLSYSRICGDTTDRSEGAGLSGLDPGKEIEESEGEFVSILAEHDSGNVHIINDRFASRPFYILQSEGRVVFSSNLFFLLHLADSKQRPDPLGWLQIFSYGHTLGTRTNVQDVKRILPASHTIISKDGVRTGRYWQLRHDVQGDLDPVRHAEETFEAIRTSAATRSRLVENGIASLSGGLDSRLVAGAIPENAGFSTFTFSDSMGTNQTVEVSAAAQVSRILGLEHHIRHISPDHLSTIADCLVGLTAGLTPIHHPAKAFPAIQEMINNTGFKVGGGPGDSLAGAFVARSIHNINPPMTDRQIYKFIAWRRRHAQKVLASVFCPDLTAKYLSGLDESMQECFSMLSGPTAAHRMTAWAMVFRQPAFTFTSPIHNHPDVTEASPHLGYDYADCMLKLPASWIYQKNFYKFMIYHCLPQLQDVIYANTGRKLPGRMQDYNISSRKKVCGAIERRLPGKLLENYRKSRLIPGTQRSFEYEMLGADKKLFSELSEILHSFDGLKELLNVTGCEQLLSDFRQGRLYSWSPENDAELLGSVATMCYWYRKISSTL